MIYAYKIVIGGVCLGHGHKEDIQAQALETPRAKAVEDKNFIWSNEDGYYKEVKKGKSEPDECFE